MDAVGSYMMMRYYPQCCKIFIKRLYYLSVQDYIWSYKECGVAKVVAVASKVDRDNHGARGSGLATFSKLLHHYPCHPSAGTRCDHGPL